MASSAQHQEIAHGWPLGLENMSLTLRLTQSSPSATAAAEPYSSTSTRTTTSTRRLHSSSFSSFSSSDLDTESTASFFQDNSMSLGRLMGIRPRNKQGSMDSTDAIRLQQDQTMVEKRSVFAISQEHHGVELNSKLCVPLFLPSVVAKMSTSKSNSRH